MSLFALFRRWRDRHDPAWKPTGYSYRFTGADEAKAVTAAKRADALAERSRALHVKRAIGSPPKRAASVVSITQRRKAGR